MFAQLARRYGSLLTRMSVRSKSDHLERTKDQTRMADISAATVSDIWNLSPTVKTLKLQVKDYKNISYKAGQWLDLMIPNSSRVGGYSMVNSPLTFAQTGNLQLAVKFSDHPPTYWVHKQCEIGSKVSIRFGGNIYYNPKPTDRSRDLLLIGGGIGINPLSSILNLVADYSDMVKADNTQCYQPGKTLLLYSSSTTAELLFKENLDELQKVHANISCRYFVTQEKPDLDEITGHRISKLELEEAFKVIDKNTCRVFICGPVEMIDNMENILVDLGLDSTQILVDKWW